MQLWEMLTPTRAVMGVQLTPTSPVTPSTATPTRDRILFPWEDWDCVHKRKASARVVSDKVIGKKGGGEREWELKRTSATALQHCREPVLHTSWPAWAAARTANARVERAARRANMMVSW